MTLFALSGIVNFISSLVFGFFVFFKDKKNRVFQFWLAFSLAVSLWEFGVYKIGVTTDKQLSLLWWRIAYIGVILIPVFFSQFIYSWLKIRRKIFFYFSWAFGLFFSALNLWDIFFNTTFFIPSIRWIFDSFYYNEPQPLYSVFVVFWFFIVLYAHYELLKVYKSSFGTKRSQIQYFIFAFLVAYAGGATCYLVVYHIDFYPYFNFTAPFYPLIMAYAIVRHRLMDIKLVMRKYSVYLVSLSAILLSAIAVKYFSEIFFPEFSTLIDFLILMVAISIYSPIKNYFYYIANKYFFSSLYDSRQVIAGLSDKLRSTLDAAAIYKNVVSSLVDSFHVKAMGFLTYDSKNKNYSVAYNKGFNIGQQKEFAQDKQLEVMFIKQNKPVIVEEIKHLKDVDKNQTVKLLIKLGVEILAPLNVKDKTIGLIALGAKESNDMYNDEDLQVLEVVGAQTAIALENALLYQETKDFSIKLEKEVEKATRDLRRANEQLKKLDAAKSEFISIASHQLRTPLTVIKGYISMMLEGNFGKLSKQEKESLDKVFESNERLIQLVENLLNISRIESGRMQFQFENGWLEKVVDSVIEELTLAAKRKGLRLDYIKPQQPLPQVKIDPEKIRQVIMNLIDNSIKYTKRGHITIKLELAGKKVRFIVADTGMGISSEDLANLFKKFSRGTGTALVHTEGTGLGLYVARMMIEAHQGKVWAESAGVGQGSKFCFELTGIK